MRVSYGAALRSLHDVLIEDFLYKAEKWEPIPPKAHGHGG
jgi:hypothetical protein